MIISCSKRMGKVVEKTEVTNFRDLSKSIKIEAVIDTGATISVLPMDLIQKLGLEKINEVSVKCLEIARRKVVFDVLAKNVGTQSLIEQIVLERLDLIIEPSTRKVIPNPRSPETPMIEIFVATSPNSGYTATLRSAQIRQSRTSWPTKRYASSLNWHDN